jgi:2-oxoglutarate ferredoxin oxidoreductase subunit beta
LPEGYDPGDRDAAMRVAQEWGERIPVGIIYRSEARLPLEQRFAALHQGSLLEREVDLSTLKKVMERFV